MNLNDGIVILLVDDDDGHARLIEKNLRRAGVSNEIIHLDNGQKAIDFLNTAATNNASNNPMPFLMLLDLNMPVMDGYQVLKYIKSEEKMKSIPIVMLTTTDSPREVAKCYDLGCNVFVTKPVDPLEFCEAIKSLGFFLSIVKVPEEKAA